MDWILEIIILIMLLIISIFAIAKYAKKSKFQRTFKKIARFLLNGIIPLSDKERDSLLER